MSGASRIAGWNRRRRVREPNFIVLFDSQMAFQRVRERGVTVVEASKIRAIDGGARENTSGNGR